MDELLENLKEYGADVDGAMGRFLDDLPLYKTCFRVFLEDEAFLKLGKALAVSDFGVAFEAAHTLKGIIGNMGLTPIYQVICKMVESLRNQDYACLQGDYAELLQHLNTLKGFQK